MLRSAGLAGLAMGVLTIGAVPEAPLSGMTPAVAETTTKHLPAAPTNGVMGFVVHHFVNAVIQGKDACPEGPLMKNREIFLNSLPP